MTTTQQVRNVTGTYEAHLLLTDTSVRADDPERVMEEIWNRATLVGAVLEDILHCPHSESQDVWND